MSAHISYHADAPLVTITADGGSRRERGARIGAAVRKLQATGVTLIRYHLAYDELWGFQSRTTASYRIHKGQ